MEALQNALLTHNFGQQGLCTESGCERHTRAGSSLWYALYVRSHHEKVVESVLKSKGYPAFSPFYRTKRKRVDRTVEIDTPLFPGYVFCRFNASQRLPILITPGIVEIVPANKPHPVDEREISSIRTLALSGLPVQPWPFLACGQRMRLNAGPLMGAEGIFLRVKDACRLVVSVSLLQRAVSVVVENEAVEPIFRDESAMRSLQI
jgi:transcription antitermination factor NusG